jgi:hypothetical protein
MENAQCCHGKERFFKLDLNTLRREQNWLPIKKKTNNVHYDNVIEIEIAL